MRILFMLLIISVLQDVSFAQVDSLDFADSYILLKNGSILRAGVYKKKKSKYVLSRQQNGNLDTIYKRKIMTVKPYRDQYEIMKNGTLFYRKKGCYRGVNFQLMASTPDNRSTFSSISGYGAQFSAGYYFNKNLSLGGGIGIANYSKDFLDFFGQTRLSLPRKAKKFIPVFGLDVGYGFPTVQDDTISESETGGFSFRPNIGFLSAIKGRGNLHIDTGLQYQRIKEFRNFGSGAWSEFKRTYQRFFIRVGFIY